MGVRTLTPGVRGLRVLPIPFRARAGESKISEDSFGASSSGLERGEESEKLYRDFMGVTAEL